MKTTEGRVLAVVATALCLAATSSVAQQKGASKPAAGVATVPVTVQNFTRAETDQYFGVAVKRGGLGKFNHDRQPTPIDKQDVVGMNRDTLYSAAVFDLDAAPVTITLPDTGKRFMSLLIVNEDHYSPAVVYAPGHYTYTKEKLGTRYMMAVVRTLIDPRDPRDIQAANAVQDAIKVEQPSIGTFEVPNWDPVSQKKIRDALIVLSGNLGDNTPPRFGWKGEIDPVMHLIVTAAGWGGNPEEAAVYDNVVPTKNDGTTAYRVTVKDVPVDGFWSITVYNKDGFMEKNDQNVYSYNNVTAKKSADGSITINFGGGLKASNNLPITPGWNYIVRMYQPKPEIINGSWSFPKAEPAK